MKLRIRVLVAAVLLLPQLSHEESTEKDRPTDGMTPQQFQNAGLTKLTAAELESLNEWIKRRPPNNNGQMPATSTAVPTIARVEACAEDSDEEIALYNQRGEAVAYILLSDDSTVYMWSGKPVAYLDDENVYGFNGKHLGWFEDGQVYDHEGKIAATTCRAAAIRLKPAPFKQFKQFKPFKAFEEFAPFKPFISISWSKLPTEAFLYRGAR